MEYMEQDSFKIKICGIKKGDIIHYSSFDPQFLSRPRNLLLFSMMARMDLVEHIGSGIQ
jgi:predicted HTH transcriptional regulator